MEYLKLADNLARGCASLVLIVTAACASSASPAAQPDEATSVGSGETAAAGSRGTDQVATLGTAGDAGAATGDFPSSPVASTPYTSAPSPAAQTTQWCQVAQVFQTRCVACHDGNQTAGAPMSLIDYSDLQAPAVSDPGRKVFELVGERVHDPVRPMPPQAALTAAELDSIDAWVAAGAPQEQSTRCPTVANGPTASAWPDHCDAVYKLLAHGPESADAPYLVPAGEEIHPKISVPAPWGDAALQAIAFRSVTDNSRVLHHWILYGPNREFLVGWAPGKTDPALPADVGMYLAGGTLTLDMHYNNLLGDQAEPDNSGVEICALTPEHFREHTGAIHRGFTKLLFNVPAKSTHYAVTAECSVTSDGPVTLLTASPHAHRYGRHMKFSVRKASGELIVMHDAPFDFNEQQSHLLEPAVQIVTGDTVITTCTYDNPTDRSVWFGENTENEMCFNFAAYYPMGALKCGAL